MLPSSSCPPAVPVLVLVPEQLTERGGGFNGNPRPTRRLTERGGALALQQHVAGRRQPPLDLVRLSRHAREAGIERRLRHPDRQRPARLDEGQARKDVVVVKAP